MTESGETAYRELIARLEKEKLLVGRLNELLREELECITSQNVEALEESMPEKQRILQDIMENRKGEKLIDRDPLPHSASHIRSLQQDLIKLWKAASGLNELSKTMVTDRLAEIDHQLEPFFTREKAGYNKKGKKNKGLSRSVNTGA